MNDSELIDKIGGTGWLAKALSQRSETISNWKRRGIPARWRPTVLNIIKVQGIKVDENKFLDINVIAK